MRQLCKNVGVFVVRGAFIKGTGPKAFVGSVVAGTNAGGATNVPFSMGEAAL